MNPETPQLVLSTSPFIKRRDDTPAIMRHVTYSLIPVMGSAAYYFGLGAVLIMVACLFGAALAEWGIGGGGPLKDSTLRDGSAVVTAILLALTLPPGLPLWMAFLGAVVAVAVGKMLFGGLGQNVFNPSLTGRAFLQASFPVALTTWSSPAGLNRFFHLTGDIFALPFTTPHIDAVSAATPLAGMKFESQPTALTDLLLGSTPGSAGETCAVAILLGGGYLVCRRFLNWRIPAGIFITVFLCASLLHLLDPGHYPRAVFHLFSGGLMLGAVFMATDPVTSPVTPLGCWIFAFGVGLLVIVIRQFGGLPEGVMYAILLMNAATPLIDRTTQPRVYGLQ